MPTNTWIYSLNDPDTLECRYVGKANNPKVRYRSHFLAREEYDVCEWFRSLKGKNKKPHLTFLLEVPMEEWDLWERAYIKAFRILGFPLLNMTDGGGSCKPVSEETRKKLSVLGRGRKQSVEHAMKRGATRRGKPRSEETKQKIRNALLGRKQSPELIEKRVSPIRGQKRSPEICKKISEALKGRTLSPSHRQNIWRSRNEVRDAAQS